MRHCAFVCRCVAWQKLKLLARASDEETPQKKDKNARARSRSRSPVGNLTCNGLEFVRNAHVAFANERLAQRNSRRGKRQRGKAGQQDIISLTSDSGGGGGGASPQSTTHPRRRRDDTHTTIALLLLRHHLIPSHARSWLIYAECLREEYVLFMCLCARFTSRPRPVSNQTERESERERDE